MIYIPNLLTLLRFGLVPVLVVVLQNQQYLASLLIFLIAGLSDGLDGFIAKRFNAETRLGAILDPLADKALLVSSYVSLAAMNAIPFWLMVAVVFRDLVIVGGYMVFVLFFGPIKTAPTKTSKLNTFLQIVFILAVLSQLAELLNLGYIIKLLSFAILISSLTSGLQYVWIGYIKSMDSTDKTEILKE